MPITTACPSCKQRLSVADQHAGKPVRCPKCEQTFLVPAVAAAPTPPGPAKPPRPVEQDRRRSPQAPAPVGRPRANHSGLFWVIGLGCAGLSLLVMGGAAIAVVLWMMPAQTKSPPTAAIKPAAEKQVPKEKDASQPNDGTGVATNLPIVAEVAQLKPKDPLLPDNQPALAIQLQNGIFQTESKLEDADGRVRGKDAPCKLYQIDLQAGRKYAIELTSNEFGGWIIVEDTAAFEVGEAFDQDGSHKARLTCTPAKTGAYRVMVTSVGNDRGTFQLTIREDNSLRPENYQRKSVSLPPEGAVALLGGRHRGFSQGVKALLASVKQWHVATPNVAQTQQPKPQPDSYPYAGLPPKKAAEVMTVPPGFTVKLFAGEPDVHQPIAFCIDDRGRLWVAEAYSYPVRRPDKEAKDRILIFEDTDGDGVFDKKTVFMEGLNLVSGLEVGFGGVWIGAAPYFMFVPVKDGEDKPAGPPQILLDGWGYQDTHETLNTFTWGPDGWLYGCHGVFTHSRVGKPGTPDKNRIPINAGVWRYHPTRHVFEVFAHGTSNPWGLDFDAHGQAFVEACVIPHNWHIIQGGRYNRQAGQHFNPYTFADIQTIAEHRHFVGANPHGGTGLSSSVGGGHAHSGAMIYQGGAWPKEYWGKMFMGNIHGHRINVDVLTPKGSGFVASAAPDFLLSNDAWAMFVNLQTGPDGNVYVIDWYDQQSCHTGNPQIWDRSNGRIYKICHKDAKPVVGLDLNKKTDAELVELQLHPNEWFARHARRILQERYGDGAAWRKDFNNVNNVNKAPKNGEAPARLKLVITALNKIAGHPEESKRLRALWALAGVEYFGSQRGIDHLVPWGDDSPYVRGWMIQLALESPNVSSDEELKSLFINLLSLWAAEPKAATTPVDRLYLASALQRIPLDKRWELLRTLIAHAEDAADHNLPLMYWYAAEPLAEKEPAKALDLALASKVPPLPRFMARRVSSVATPEALALVVDRLAKTKDQAIQLAILRGMQDALKGRRDVAMPANWPTTFAALAASKNGVLHSAATTMAVTFGDAKAFAALREQIASSRNAPAARQEALATLLAARDNELVPVMHKLLDDSALRGPALRGLAAFDDVTTPSRIVAVYPSLSAQEKRDAVNTLASRSAYGQALLDAVAAKKIVASDVSAEVVRQLRNLKDKALDQRIAEVWGIFRATPADRAKQITDLRRFLNTPAKTDLSVGRAVFSKTCQQCHTLFGVGGQVGPDITGGNRANLDYLLENILDPSAVIPKEYTTTVLELKNGRVVTGIVRGETAAALTIQTVNETLTIARDDIDSSKQSNVSMMPDDLLGPLTKDEVRALIAYLQSSVQVPMLDVPRGKD
jgi:putative membrane-bound dehydrogenase-like protein